MRHLIEQWKAERGTQANTKNIILALQRVGPTTTAIQEKLENCSNFDEAFNISPSQLNVTDQVKDQPKEDFPLLPVTNPSSSSPAQSDHAVEKEEGQSDASTPVNFDNIKKMLCVKVNVSPVAIILALVFALAVGASVGHWYPPEDPVSQSPSKATITVQVGGKGKKPSNEVTEIHRPATTFCQKNRTKIPHLPRPLRSHVALEVTGLGLLVCGGKSEDEKDPGRNCFVFKHETGNWEEYYSLNFGRLNSYMKQTDTKIYIVGGSIPDPFTPCLSSVEVLDLALDTGWHLEEGGEGLCSQVGEVVVELKCL